jgi:hypothetical protein
MHVLLLALIGGLALIAAGLFMRMIFNLVAAALIGIGAILDGIERALRFLLHR